MTFSKFILIWNKHAAIKKHKFLTLNFSSKNLQFLKLLLKLTIINKLIILNKLIKFRIDKSKVQFLFLKKKNHATYVTKMKLVKLAKTNIYIYSTNKGLQTSLNSNLGGILIAKIIFKN